ncbi:MAG: hypothetical protein DRP08_03925, partial [Candidatus Aenigmatarchaeota archaeon]
MNQHNETEREPVRGVIGNSGALPMYYVSKKDSKISPIKYSTKTKILVYLFAAMFILCFLFFYWVLI